MQSFPSLRYLFDSKVGRLLLAATPTILCVPYILFTDRYSSLSRIFFLFLVSIGCFITIRFVSLGSRVYRYLNYRLFFTVVLLYGGLLLFLVYGVRYLNYTTNSGLAATDVAIFEQSLWNTVQGNGLLYNSITGASHLASHFSPILLVLVSAYVFIESAFVLFAFQTTSICITALLLFRLAEDTLSSEAAFFLGSAYLVHILVIDGQLTFHETFFAPPLFLWAVWSIHRNQLGAFLISSALLLTINERSFLSVLGLVCVRTFLTHINKKPLQWRWIGFPLLLVGLGSLASVGTMDSLQRPDSHILPFVYFQHLGNGPVEILRSLTGEPLMAIAPLKDLYLDKLLLLYQLSAPYLGFAFFSVWLIGILPEWAVYLFANGLTTLTWHYATILAGLLLSLMFALIEWQKKGLNKAYIAIIAVVIFFNTVALWPMRLNPSAFLIDAQQKEVMQRIVSSVPSDATVCADYTLVQYFSKRERLFHNQVNSSQELNRCEYIIIDRNIPHGRNNLSLDVFLQGDTSAKYKTIIDSAGIALLHQLSGFDLSP